jgi:amino acid adenylation domain-containing protein
MPESFLLSKTEWQQIVVDFNNTITPYSAEKTLFSLFEERAVIQPTQVALRKRSKTLTYDELNRQSNQLAHFLINIGVLPGDNIGLLATRDFDMISGMLGILKAGGAYVPIDPDYPIDRQEYIFNQSSIKLVIADNNYPLKSLLNENTFIKIGSKKLADYKDTNPDLTISSQQLAYTIYTSGSTGRPKGVMIAHHSAVNLVQWVNKTYNVGPGDNLLFITSMCFDLSVYDIFGMLAAGGSIVIAEQQEIQDVKQLQKMLVDYNITFWDSVPTTLDYLVRNLELTEPGYTCPSLKTVFMSGDWIPVDLPERLKKFFPQTQVISLGGATEGTVWSNYFPVIKTNPEWKSIPYGRPIDNNFFYILNDELQPVPVGVIGDLYIGGAGVARGYAGDKEKTDAAFVTDPFNDKLGGMMYRTGDLGRMAPDMNMEFIGRKDNQVKILGFRIELGEIESVLNTCELVTSAVVLAKNNPEGKKRLIGYVVPAGKFNKEAIVSHLKTKLPHYMMPAIWIALNELPLTSNGKIDRNSLPDVEETAPEDKKLIQPSSTTEKVLKSIWQDCMGLKDLSVDDNFFELGGHSLIAAQILSIFKNKTGHNLQLAVLFQYPSIKSLAKFIDGETVVDEASYTCLVPIKPTGTKTPLYIIHGEGLNVLKFNTLATILDDNQPVWGLQARGLNGVDEPMDDMRAIAEDYLQEILRHNPSGPYILGGYSFGGYVAVEIQQLLEAMGKEVKMLVMFDTDSERPEPKKWFKVLPKKIARNAPKALTFLKSNVATVEGEFQLPSTKFSKKQAADFYKQIDEIMKKHLIAFRNYKLNAFNAKVYLFRADISVHYVNDKVFLGWKRFAKKGVEVYAVPGDHRSMLEQPNVKVLADALQKVLNENAE